MKVNINNFFEYICRQLKYHEHSIRGEIGISLKIILNVFKCLTVSLVPLKFLLQQKHQFCLIQLSYSVNLLCCQMHIFCCPLKKWRYHLTEGTDAHIWQHIHKKRFNYFFGNTSEVQDCRSIALSLVLLVQTFDKIIDQLEK